MGLKDHLTEYLKKTSQHHQLKLQSIQEAQEDLGSVDLRNSGYVVKISHWRNSVEESTSTETIGSIEEAIVEAEQEYKRVNKMDKIEGAYSVYIVLGKERLTVPREYWDEFTEKNRA